MNEIVKNLPKVEQPQQSQVDNNISKIIIISVIMGVVNALCSAEIFCLPTEFAVKLNDVVYNFSPMALLNIIGFVAVIVFRKWFLNTTKLPTWLNKILELITNINPFKLRKSENN